MFSKFFRDLLEDLVELFTKFLTAGIKVAIAYQIILMATNLHHEQALETAILVGAVDVLAQGKTKLKTVEDFCSVVKTKAKTTITHYRKSS